MPERVPKCPQCDAPLAPPSRFARSVVCAFCGATVQLDPSVVSAARYRDAFARWIRPEQHGYAAACSLDGGRWAFGEFLARGAIADVYLAERARLPSERVVLKALRDDSRAARFDDEWDVLGALQGSSAAGAAQSSRLLPQPVARGVLGDGPHAGARAMLLRRESGFRHTLQDVRRAFPAGVDPRASIWMWRRTLEALSFVHRSGWLHGAVAPEHLLVEDGEHGVRLIGFGHAARGADPAGDLAMSACAIAYALGGDVRTGEVPAAVPQPLAYLLTSAASGDGGDAWQLRERVGDAGRALFGAPAFHPIVWPS
jgi:hypothetical protein